MTARSSPTRPVSIPTRNWPTGCSSRPRRRCPRGGEAPGALRTRMPLPVARMARAHGTLRTDALDEREGMQPRQRRHGGVLRPYEDGVRLSRALGGTHPRRGACPDRRVHPLVQPRAHQTVAGLDESGTISSKPRNGCVTISKKTSAASLSRRTRC